MRQTILTSLPCLPDFDDVIGKIILCLKAFDDVICFQCGHDKVEQPQTGKEDSSGVFQAGRTPQFSANASVAAQDQDKDSDECL